MRGLICMIVMAVVFLAGCKRPHSDMGRQDKYATYEPSSFFADGMSARPPVAGAVARDEDGGVVPPPPRITPEAILRGQASFDTFCAVCHGRLGNGEGMIVRRGFGPPPSFHVPRLRAATDRHFYDVITQGYGAMFSYGDRVSPERRWEIVAYVRLLQASSESAGASLSASSQAALVGAGDRPTAGGAR